MVIKKAPFNVHISETKSYAAYINDDSFVQQALFLGSHDKVMRVVPVVHNVLQVNTCAERARNANSMLNGRYYSNGFISGTRFQTQRRK